MATSLNTSTEPVSEFGNPTAFQEEERAVLNLDVDGLIRSCNKAAAKLMECPTSLLVWQHVSNILPQLAGTKLMQDGHVNPRLRFLSRVGHRFELAMPGGRYMSSRIFFNDLENSGRHNVRLIICLDDGHVPS
ncbi:MAG TPA: hypothetical protein VK959_01335 [Methylophilaceae bacterium]|jgi:hypothetical protein|nr:hypothetical protein [Methylophilaceae bacterium]